MIHGTCALRYEVLYHGTQFLVGTNDSIQRHTFAEEISFQMFFRSLETGSLGYVSDGFTRSAPEALNPTRR